MHWFKDNMLHGSDENLVFFMGTGAGPCNLLKNIESTIVWSIVQHKW